MKKYIPFLVIASFLPAIAFAQFTQVISLISQLTGIIDLLVPLFLTIAVLVFIWGVIKYALSDGPDRLAEARNYIIFSIIGIAVILGVWSLSAFLVGSFFPQSPAATGPTNSGVYTGGYGSTGSGTGSGPGTGCILEVTVASKSGGCVPINSPSCKQQAVFPGECN